MQRQNRFTELRHLMPALGWPKSRFENAGRYGRISPAMASREFIEQCRRDEAEQRKKNIRDGILILLLILAVAGILAILGVKVDPAKFVR